MGFETDGGDPWRREQFRQVVGEPFSGPFEEGLLAGPEAVEGQFGTF